MNLIALSVTDDGGRNYLFPYAHLLFAELSANPAVEKQPDAPPQRLHIYFAIGEIIILGSGLRRLELELQKGSLKFARRVSQDYSSALQTNIVSITVTRKELA
jgi:hypothetical protein